MEVAMEIDAALAALAVAVATACSASLCLFPVAASARDRVVRLNDHFELLESLVQDDNTKSVGRGQDRRQEGEKKKKCPIICRNLISSGNGFLTGS